MHLGGNVHGSEMVRRIYSVALQQLGEFTHEAGYLFSGDPRR
jgi:hypothetical protein